MLTQINKAVLAFTFSPHNLNVLSSMQVAKSKTRFTIGPANFFPNCDGMAVLTEVLLARTSDCIDTGLHRENQPTWEITLASVLQV